MLYELLITLFVILCLLMIPLILVQKSKGSLGIIGSAGSGAQLLFGGTGGQDFLQKLTWTFVALFLTGSLVLSLLKNASVNESRYLSKLAAPEAVQQPIATAPVTTESPAPETTSAAA